jgi:hypothetical protein
MSKAGEVRPRMLRIDEISATAHSSQIVGPPDQAFFPSGIEVRRDLNGNLRETGFAEPDELLHFILRNAMRRKKRLSVGHIPLEDDLLEVPVFFLEGLQAEDGSEAVLLALADSHQDPGRKRDLQPTGGFQRIPSLPERLARMNPAVHFRIHPFDHEPHRSRDVPEPFQRG